MAPVAALIVVRPCIEVNAVEGDSLDADAQDQETGTHFSIEAVLVHAEIGGGVAHADKAGQRRGVHSEARGLWAHLRRRAAAGKQRQLRIANRKLRAHAWCSRCAVLTAQGRVVTHG